jgi:acyl dehydratase
MREINGIEGLKDAVGETLGTSEWHEVTQEDINAFADVTGDHQWIHVDTERAKDTPFGGTIAHGYYTLSLAPKFMDELVAFKEIAFALNYGLGKVRFPAALPVGKRVRATLQLANVEDVQGGVQITMAYTFEGEGIDKPVCVAETLARVYGG